VKILELEKWARDLWLAGLMFCKHPPRRGSGRRGETTSRNRVVLCCICITFLDTAARSCLSADLVLVLLLVLSEQHSHPRTGAAHCHCPPTDWDSRPWVSVLLISW